MYRDDFWTPLLEGPTLFLRPLKLNDFNDLYEAASDPQIWALHPDFDRWQKPVFQKYFDKATTEQQALVIIDKETDSIIGSSRFYDFVNRESPRENEVKIGFTFLVRRHWGGKTNQELKTLMIHHAIQKAEKVLFEIGKNNYRSRRAVEKIGAILVDEPTLEIDHVVYQITKSSLQQKL